MSEMTEERKAEILQRSRALQERLEKTLNSPEALAERAARQKRIREEELNAEVEHRIWGTRAPIPAPSKPSTPAPPAPDAAPPPDLNRERFVSIERAKELCDFAWNAVEFKTGQHGNGEPNVNGNCVGKSRWLQRHLGGVLITGYRKDVEKGGRHAALLFPIEGKLYVADWGEVIPIEEYPFHICGFRT